MASDLHTPLSSGLNNCLPNSLAKLTFMYVQKAAEGMHAHGLLMLPLRGAVFLVLDRHL
jgi:hypothetical protein